MGFLKGLGTFVFSFLLFLVLTIFSIAFMLHGTILNPDFITTELNKLDVTSIVNETVKVNEGQNGLSQELKTSIIDAVTKLEPMLKQQVSGAIYRVYDYLLGKVEEPRLATVLSDTVASNDFIVAAINDIDISSIVQEVIAENESEEPGGFPKDLTTDVVDTLTKLEPQLKEEIGSAIAPINDYLWGKRQDLSLASVLSETILRTDFVVSVVNEVDIAALTKDYVSSQLTEAVPQNTSELTAYLTNNLDEIITRLEPWLKEQITIAAGPAIDYLLGKSQTINVTIATEPVLTVVQEILKDAILSSPPPEIAGMSRAEQEQYIDDFFTQFSSNLPSTFTFDEELLGPTRDNVTDLMAQGEEQLSKMRDDITDGLSKAEDPLAKARKYVGYFQTYYYPLVGVMIILAAIIFLINWNVKKAARSLGINFLVWGVLDLVGVIVAKSISPMQYVSSRTDISASLGSWIDGLSKDIASVAMPLSIGILVVGVALLVVSFIVPKKEAKS
jgi:hypothetical protein